MAPFEANSFGILDGDDDDNMDNLLSRLVAKALQPPAVPENTTNNNNKKPIPPVSKASFESSSDNARQRKFTDPVHVSRRPNKDGVERYNNAHANGGYRQNNKKPFPPVSKASSQSSSDKVRPRNKFTDPDHVSGKPNQNVLQRYNNNGHASGYRENNGNFRKNNGYYQDNRQTDGFRRFSNERSNSYHNKQDIYVNDRSNDRNNGHKHYRRVDSSVNEANRNTKAPTHGNGSQIGRGERRVVKGNQSNASEVKDGDNNEKVGDFAVENEDGWQIARSRRRRYRSLSNSVGEKESSETKEKNDGEGVEKEVVVAEEGDRVTVKAVASEESAKNEEIVKVISKEEAESLAKEEAEKARKQAEWLAKKEAWDKREAERLEEGKKMTLKEYEKKLEEDRKKKLEEKNKVSDSSKIEEGQKVVRKENVVQESSPENLAQFIVRNFRRAGSNYGRRGRRFSNEGNRDGNNNHNDNDNSVKSFKKADGRKPPSVEDAAKPLKKADGPKPPSVEDSNHFPALGATVIRT